MRQPIVINDEEKRARRLTDTSFREAINALNVDGYVILQNAVETAHLDILLERTLSDLEQILARPDVPFNFTNE